MIYRGPSYDVDRTLKVGMAARGFARNETMPAYCSQLRIQWYGIEFDTNTWMAAESTGTYINDGGGGVY